MSKDTFKSFARLHPELATTVLEGKASWQQLYELYEIYGEDTPLWGNYLQKESIQKESQSSFKDIFNTLKNLDMDTVQKGITNLQKTIGLLQDVGLTNKPNIKTYEPRPIYKNFGD